MGRTSNVASHPQRARIESMLDDGVPYATIARTVGGASTAGVGRFALSRKSELAKIADGEPGVTDVLSRLVQLADHARDVRQHSRIGGSPVAQNRAIKGEADILGKLLSELGIDDITVTESLTEARVMVQAFRVFVREYPESARDLAQVLADIPETAELAQALSRVTTPRNNS